MLRFLSIWICKETLISSASWLRQGCGLSCIPTTQSNETITFSDITLISMHNLSPWSWNRPSQERMFCDDFTLSRLSKSGPFSYCLMLPNLSIKLTISLRFYSCSDNEKATHSQDSTASWACALVTPHWTCSCVNINYLVNFNWFVQGSEYFVCSERKAKTIDLSGLS